MRKRQVLNRKQNLRILHLIREKNKFIDNNFERKLFEKFVYMTRRRYSRPTSDECGLVTVIRDQLAEGQGQQTATFWPTWKS